MEIRNKYHKTCSQAIGSWFKKAAPLALLPHEACRELFLWVGRPCFLSCSWTVGGCCSLPAIYKTGCHSPLNRQDHPSPLVTRPLHLSLPEGNRHWPEWFKRAFTNGVPAKVSKLQRICLSGTQWRRGGGGRALSQKLNLWPNFCLSHPTWGTWPSKVPTP